MFTCFLSVPTVTRVQEWSWWAATCWGRGRPSSRFRPSPTGSPTLWWEKPRPLGLQSRPAFLLFCFYSFMIYVQVTSCCLHVCSGVAPSVCFRLRAAKEKKKKSRYISALLQEWLRVHFQRGQRLKVWRLLIGSPILNVRFAAAACSAGRFYAVFRERLVFPVGELTPLTGF